MVSVMVVEVSGGRCGWAEVQGFQDSCGHVDWLAVFVFSNALVGATES